MPVAVESTVTTTPLPLPAHFALAEQSFSSFSLKRRRRLPFSSSSTSLSPHSSPVQPSPSFPRCPPPPKVVIPQPKTPWKPISSSLSSTTPQTSLYDPSKQQSYFEQCFTNLGLLGRGSFGEVYKVLSHEDGRHYAVKRSVQQFRGNNDRNRCVKEARNHERLCPHPHILGFVAAWEEASRLYIQTELCCTTLLLHVEDQPPTPDEPAAWSYLCDLLSALHHLHSQGFVHLDIKPANVFLTRSGRLKLGDFGLLLELPQRGSVSLGDKEKEEDLQEGDPRYMALELLRGEYGPEADIFSLGITILELACNMEIPTGGDGWQKLRQGYLPSEFTNALSTELQTVLRMMLAPEPSERATVTDLLSLPSVRRNGWRRYLSLLLHEAMLTLLSLYQSVVSIGWRLLSSLHLPILRWTVPAPCTPPKDSWERDFTLPLSILHNESVSLDDDDAAEDVFILDPNDSPTFSHRIKSRLSFGSTSTPLRASQTTYNQPSPAQTPNGSVHGHSPSCSLAPTPSSIHSNGSCLTASPTHTESQAHSLSDHSSHSRHCACSSGSQRRSRYRDQTEDLIALAYFEPKNLKKNLLSLFEESAVKGKQFIHTD